MSKNMVNNDLPPLILTNAVSSPPMAMASNTWKEWLKTGIETKKNITPAPITFSHTGGCMICTFPVPGIDPKYFKILNKNRKITLFNKDAVIGIISTYDQIDVTEVIAFYEFGQLIVKIVPNLEKFKEYEIKVNI